MHLLIALLFLADPSVEEGATLEDILAAEGAGDEVELQLVDDGRWAMRDALMEDFAHTPRLETLIQRQLDLQVGPWLDDPRWLEQLEREAMASRLRGAPAHQAQEAEPLAFDIPLADHALVDTYIDYFTGRGRWFFEQWLARSDRYIPLMLPILEKKGLPRDLVYVAMIESGFSSRATSWAAASGFWQFIPPTGRLYGLRQDGWMDERRDFIRATEAAADYLSFLHQEFGDWHLAWAGYNAGEGRVRRAIAKYGTRDFWELVRREGLAKETRHYVPKIIAAAIVSKNREKYGFKVKSLSPLEWDEIEVDDAVALGKVAQQLHASMEEMHDLNPALVYDVTPPGRRAKLRVPAGTGEAVLAWLEGLPREQRVSYVQYKVQRGDTLARIAERYGSTIAAVSDFNSIKNARALKLGQLLIVPQKVGPTRVAAKKPPSPGGQVVARHRVAEGETLWSIAQRYGVSVDRLKSWNGRRGNSLGVGEVLTIYREPGRPET